MSNSLREKPIIVNLSDIRFSEIPNNEVLYVINYKEFLFLYHKLLKEDSAELAEKFVLLFFKELPGVFDGKEYDVIFNFYQKEKTSKYPLFEKGLKEISDKYPNLNFCLHYCQNF